jgi:predicted AAA+ superfamily ATPase
MWEDHPRPPSWQTSTLSLLHLDDAATLAAARSDITGFVSRLEKHAILDEVQHVPELFAALKPIVDANRNAVRFILTGSSNVLLVPRLSDSLAGRMCITVR